jgi:hypothetical protein
MIRVYAAMVITAVSRFPSGQRSGYWLPEAAYPWFAMAEAGWRVVVISTREGQPEPGGVDQSDPVQHRFLTDDRVRERLKQTHRVEFYSPEDFGLLVYAGGSGALLDPRRVHRGGPGHRRGRRGLQTRCRRPPPRPGSQGSAAAGRRTLTAPTPVEERMLALEAVGHCCVDG